MYRKLISELSVILSCCIKQPSVLMSLLFICVSVWIWEFYFAPFALSDVSVYVINVSRTCATSSADLPCRKLVWSPGILSQWMVTSPSTIWNTSKPLLYGQYNNNTVAPLNSKHFIHIFKVYTLIRELLKEPSDLGLNFLKILYISLQRAIRLKGLNISFPLDLRRFYCKKYIISKKSRERYTYLYAC